MDIKTFIDKLSPEEKEKFAKRADTSVAYLSQLAHGHRNAGIKTIVAIEEASNGIVTRYDLRPDIFGSKPSAEVA
jgi:DNA-binding transcriptional regulator YdaS (Cro superfamily)